MSSKSENVEEVINSPMVAARDMVEKPEFEHIAAAHLHSKKAIYEDALVLVDAHGGLDSVTERRLIRKVDWFVMPMVCHVACIIPTSVLIVRMIDVFHLRSSILRQNRHWSCSRFRLEG